MLVRGTLAVLLGLVAACGGQVASNQAGDTEGVVTGGSGANAIGGTGGTVTAGGSVAIGATGGASGGAGEPVADWCMPWTEGCLVIMPVPPPCGNRYLDSTVGEQCDDGNTQDGDGCSSTCQLETGGMTGAGGASARSCPSSTPDACAACDSIGLECQYAANTATCGDDGTWSISSLRGSGPPCPTAIPTYGDACAGEGVECEYLTSICGTYAVTSDGSVFCDCAGCGLVMNCTDGIWQWSGGPGCWT